MEREIRDSSQRGDSFGSANLAMVAHGITTALPTHITSGPDSEYYMAQFYGNFGNLAASTTNSGAALDQLDATTTTQ